MSVERTGWEPDHPEDVQKLIDWITARLQGEDMPAPQLSSQGVTKHDVRLITDAFVNAIRDVTGDPAVSLLVEAETIGLMPKFGISDEHA